MSDVPWEEQIEEDNERRDMAMVWLERAMDAAGREVGDDDPIPVNAYISYAMHALTHDDYDEVVRDFQERQADLAKPKEYEVQFRVSGGDVITVEAGSEEEANEKARDEIDKYMGDFEFDITLVAIEEVTE